MRPFCDIDADAFLRSFEEEVGPERDGDPYAGEPPPAGVSEPSFYDPWSDPKPPRFPRGILPPGMEGTVFDLALRDGIDPGAQAMALLTAASGVAHKGSRFLPYANSDWSVPPIIWTMLVADSGQKKTVVGDNVFRTIRELDADAWRQHGKRIKNWRSLPKNEQKQTPEPEEPHTFFVEDVTVEKLQMIIAATNRGTLLMKDEIAGFLGFGRYGKEGVSAERGFYLQAYEAAPYHTGRVGRGSLFIETNGLTVYGAIQPDRLAEFKDLDSDGLVQRMCIVRAGEAEASRPDIRVQQSRTRSGSWRRWILPCATPPTLGS